MRASTRTAALAAGILLLAGCETAATYHPLESRSGTGYTDEQLASNRYRVTFTGNSVTGRQTVENYLLLRSAEVTAKAGYRWFMFDTRDTEARTIYQSDFMGWPGWRGRGWYWHSWRYGGWGMGGEATSYPITRYQAYAEIILLTDNQAKAEPRALNAQDVLDHVGPMARPLAPPK